PIARRSSAPAWRSPSAGSRSGLPRSRRCRPPSRGASSLRAARRSRLGSLPSAPRRHGCRPRLSSCLSDCPTCPSTCASTRSPAVRSAGFLYLLMAHLGAIAILLSFGVLHGGSGDYSFDALRAAQLTPGWASVAFALAFAGFGAKAGLIPLHAWLPEAHPAAPTPVSALMSGVMIKTAIYGLVRVSYDLIGAVRWEWGLLVLIIGAGTTLFGVLYALMQHDLKRLLAYHSIENIGIIL